MTKANKVEQQKAIEQLREWLKPGDTVYTILRNVSRSGMSREIGVAIMRDGSMLHPNYSVSKALNYRTGKRDGIIMGGCGMDMGFALVYNLGRTLFPEGFALPEGKRGRNGRTVGQPMIYRAHYLTKSGAVRRMTLAAATMREAWETASKWQLRDDRLQAVSTVPQRRPEVSLQAQLTGV